jgi:hypothetical protein
MLGPTFMAAGPRTPGASDPGARRAARTVAKPEAWPVVLKGRLPAYISWARFEQNLAQLEANHNASLGVVRQGPSARLRGCSSAVGAGCAWPLDIPTTATDCAIPALAWRATTASRSASLWSERPSTSRRAALVLKALEVSLKVAEAPSGRAGTAARAGTVPSATCFPPI